MDKLFTKQEFIKATGVPRQTIERWLRQGKINSAAYDDNGKLLFTEEQIKEAKAFHKPEKYHRNKTAPIVDAPDNQTVGNAAEDTRSTELGIIADPAAAVDLENAISPRPEKAIEGTAALMNAPYTEKITVEGVDNASVADELIPLAERADHIRQLIVDVQKGVIAIGFELIAAKRQVGHGNWSEWLKREFDWDIRTAQNYMRVAERFGNAKTFSYLGKSQLIKLLALPEGDEIAFVEAQADIGKPIESQSAREIQSAVKQWNQTKEIVGSYFNATGAAKNDSVVDELNTTEHAPTSAQEPRQDVQSGAADTEYAPAEIDSKASTNETADNKTFFSSREEEAADVDEFVLTMEAPPAEFDAAKKLPPIAQNRNGTVEWYTPAEYIEAARQVLGTIDLDPASSIVANETVKAENFFTANDNGLAKEWSGRVWLNPPFTSGLIEQFANKLVAEFNAGNVTEAVALVDNATETRWFRKFADSSHAIVFTTGRINFRKGGTFEEGSPTRGQAFFYLGGNPDKFYEAFAKFGWCCRVVCPVSLEKEKDLSLF